MTRDEIDTMWQQALQESVKAGEQFTRYHFAALVAAANQPAQKTCNCRWDGETQVQQCTLHAAHVDAIHEWAERAKTAEAKLKAQQQEPTVEDNSQNWRGMDGTTAYWLIQRHADGWADIGKMMGEWLAANQAQPAQQQEPVYFCDYGYEGWGKVDADMAAANLADGMTVEAYYTSPPASKPLTDEMVVAAARMLSDRQAAACNVDCGDMWKMHGNDFIEDARAALEAAHGIKGDA